MRLPAALVILDGYGLAPEGPGNAIAFADTPNLDRLFTTYPWTRLDAAGLAVGLPEGQMGNSEVGHLNIGAGRVVYQELTRINLAIKNGSIRSNGVLCGAIDGARDAGNAVHFMGLLSDGGVHSHIDHLFALVRMAAERGAERIFIHCFLDGRDTPPSSGLGYVEQLQAFLDELGAGRIASVSGRYYAMDRDTRWERTERAWRALVLGEGNPVASGACAVRASYDAGVTDEFLLPAVVRSAGADDCRVAAEAPPVGVVSDGDTVVFFNFRPDRARQLTRAMTDPGFEGFQRPAIPALRFVCLTEYDPTIPAAVAFPKSLPCCTLADVLSEAGLRQLHIAETEKYAHVTFFLNGGAEAPKLGEERVLIPSPRAATYDLVPQMSAPEVTDALVGAIEADRADVYIVNYANCDMVGHTGVLPATIAAVEAVDACVVRVVEALRLKGGIALITADHGNAEHMLDTDGSMPFTAHTVDEVPLVAVADDVSGLLDGGKLADVAPTLLDLIGLPQPDEWTGHTLVVS